MTSQGATPLFSILTGPADQPIVSVKTKLQPVRLQTVQMFRGMRS